jgi:hypothetical protein
VPAGPTHMLLMHVMDDFASFLEKAQDGFQGVDTSPSLQGDLPGIEDWFPRGQWVILAS